MGYLDELGHLTRKCITGNTQITLSFACQNTDLQGHQILIHTGSFKTSTVNATSFFPTLGHSTDGFEWSYLSISGAFTLGFYAKPNPVIQVLTASGVRVFSSQLFCLCWSPCTVTWSLCSEGWVSFPSAFILKQTDSKGFQVSLNAQLHWRPYIAWDQEQWIRLHTDQSCLRVKSCKTIYLSHHENTWHLVPLGLPSMYHCHLFRIDFH